jgi:hypothetical protein
MVGAMPALAKTWSILPDVTSTFSKGTEEFSGSGRGLTSLAKTLPPCLITLRRVARPMPDDAPIVCQ